MEGWIMLLRAKRRFWRIFRLFWMQFTVSFRSRTVLIATILFPLILIGIFGFAFQTNDPTESTIDLALVSSDQGIPDGDIFNETGEPIVSKTYYQDQFIDLLENVTFENTDTEIFLIKRFDIEDEALQEVERRAFQALLILPEGFTNATLASRRHNLEFILPLNWTDFPPANYTTKLQVKGDATLMSFSVASNTITNIATSFFNLGQDGTIGASVRVDGSLRGEASLFDKLTPGVIIFALLSNLAIVATTTLKDVKGGQLERLRLTRMTSFDYLMGLIVSQLVFSIIQISFMFGIAVVFGFNITINTIYAALFCLLINLSVTGLSLLLSGFVKTQEAARSLALAVGAPMAFVAGAFFEMPNPTIIPRDTILGNNSFGIFDIIPARPALIALRVMLLTNRDISVVAYEIWLTIILSVIYLVIGMTFFKIKHFKPQ